MIKTKTTSKRAGKLSPGSIVNLKITALGPNNIGINEFSFGMPVLVPNAKLGDTVQVKIFKIVSTSNVAIAKLIKVVQSVQTKKSTVLPKSVDSSPKAKTTKAVLKPGDSLEVTINKLGPNSTGVVELDNAFQNVTKVFVPSIEKSQIGNKANITITRIKTNYAVGILTKDTKVSAVTKTVNFEDKLNQQYKGTKFSLLLPKKHLNKTKGSLKYMVVKFSNKNTNQRILPSNTLLFVKPSLGSKAGDKVQIQITKFFSANESLKYNVAIAKITKLNPLSNKQKKALVKTSLRQMLKSGMHYGEKAIKCNARMKNYVWIRKQGQNVNKPLLKKGRNIINLLKTRRCLNKALAQLAKYAVKGKTFLFVGTKKAASGLVSRASLFSKKAFFVNTRWLGGMLTNWSTIKKSISKIRPILKEKQIIMKDILEKRQTIKSRLLQKAILLRKKSKVMLKKGRQFIQMLRTTQNNGANLEKNNLEKINLLNGKRKDLISKGSLLLEKRVLLLQKRQEIISQSQALKAKATALTSIYRNLLSNLVLSRQKLRELKALLIISHELQAFKAQTLEQNQNLYTVSYNKIKALNGSFVLSNPPKEILNKMVAIIKGQGLIMKDTIEDFGSKLNIKSGLAGETNPTNKTKMLSQLLSKFSLFVPTIKTSIQNLQNYTANLQKNLTVVKNLLNTVKSKMISYVDLHKQIVLQLAQIKLTLQTERNIIRLLKRKFKQISSQKRFMKFLPKLRYLPTPTHKLEQTARFLMKKFVDPKMKYPMDSIYDQKLSGQSKKVAASRKKKWQRLEKYLGGISNMTKLQEKHIRNNIAIIIGQQEEMNAVRECQKLGIKMFHIVDTNCNPGFADHFIPANDDARNSIKFILGKFLTRIRLAQKLKTNKGKKAVKSRK